MYKVKLKDLKRKYTCIIKLQGIYFNKTWSQLRGNPCLKLHTKISQGRHQCYLICSTDFLVSPLFLFHSHKSSPDSSNVLPL